MKYIKYLIIVLLVAGLLAVKLLYFPSTSTSNGGVSNAKKNELVLANATIVKSINFINEIQLPGNLISNKEIQLCAERSGRVTATFFKEGTFVQKGDLLIKINDATLQAQLKKLKANESFLLQTEERKRNLLKINGISQQEYDAALSELNNIRAELDYINAQIQETEIKAPFAGKIGVTNITEGAFVSAGTPLLTLQQTDPLKIDFLIPEKNVYDLNAGDSIFFNNPATGKKTLAFVYALNSKIDSETRQLNVRAIVANPKNELISGSDVIISVNFKSKAKSILIPTESVISTMKGKKVFVYRNGKAEEISVECGIRTEERIEILKGLQNGDTVLTSGILQLKKGASVKINKMQ